MAVVDSVLVTAMQALGHQLPDAPEPDLDLSLVEAGLDPLTNETRWPKE